MELVWFGVGVVAGALSVGAWARQKRVAGTTTAASATVADAGNLESTAEPEALPVPDATASAEDRLQTAKREVEALDDAIQRPADLLQQAAFREGTDLLAGPDFDAARVIDGLTAQGYVLPSMAANALASRDDVEQHKVLDALPNLGAYAMHFVLAWLQTRPDATALGALVQAAREWWWDYAGLRADLRRYLQWAALQPGHDAP